MKFFFWGSVRLAVLWVLIAGTYFFESNTLGVLWQPFQLVMTVTVFIYTVLFSDGGRFRKLQVDNHSEVYCLGKTALYRSIFVTGCLDTIVALQWVTNTEKTAVLLSFGVGAIFNSFLIFLAYFGPYRQKLLK